MSAMQGTAANIRLVSENDELTVSLSALAALSETPTVGLAEYIEVYQELAYKVAAEASLTDYPGIYELWMYYQEGVANLSRDKEKLDTEEHKLLSEWPRLIMAYLKDPTILHNREALVTHLRHPLLALPISDDNATALSTMLDSGLPRSANDIDEPSTHDKHDESFLDDEMAGTFQSCDEALPLPPRDLVSALLSQLTVMQEPLNNLQDIISSESTHQDIQSSVEVYAGYLERFGKASSEVGLVGMYDICQHVVKDIRNWVGSDSALLCNMSDVLNNLMTHVRSYLLAPYIHENSIALVNCLRGSDWKNPLTLEAAMSLLPLFHGYDQPVDGHEQQDEEYQKENITENHPVAMIEDVSLDLPDDVDDELFEIMLEELPDQTAQLSEAVQNLIKGGSMEDVKVAQRMAHSLKGAGNTIGVKGVANLTHHLEDILIKFSEQERLPGWSLSMTMMKAVDCLEGMGEALRGDATSPDDATAVLQEVLDWVDKINREGLPQEENKNYTEDPDDSLSMSIDLGSLSDSISADALSASGAMQALTDSMQAMPALSTRQQGVKRKYGSNDSATIRVPASLVDNLLRLAGEATIMTGLMRERVRQTAGQIQNLQSEFNRMRSLGADLERLVDIKDFTAAHQSRNSHTDFDTLEMDQYNELHTYSRMLAETATDSQELGYQVKQELMRMEDMLVDQDLLNRETQDTVMDVRMVPVKNIVSKLQRSVRQTARLTDKQIDFQVKGEDTYMDGNVLAELADPLMHLLRNAIDHGIEPPEKRRQLGKATEGNILMEFLREGNNILVRCKDDGAGIDFNAIRRKAESLGILNPGDEVTDDVLKRILLLS
ncbi:MAG: Hpt domain-containing protein, partial [Gammaproteobacteria bacterium]|nr:Hpt domain-containing protein [Gammaproteobacteria bacterium]